MKTGNIHIAVYSVAVILIVFLVTTFSHNFAGEIENKDEITGQASLCASHQLSVGDCFMCNPALREPGRLWCKEHDRYEDRCFICHPELKDEKRLWCSEHNLYEDECIFCHPELKKKQAGDDKETAGGGDLQCMEHGVLEKECGICHPELADGLKPGEGLKIRFESPSSAKKAGIELSSPVRGEGLSDRSLLCRVTYNQNRFARVTPLAEGIIQNVPVDVGDMVAAGQVLVEVMCPEIAEAKSRYLMAIADRSLKEKTFERKKELRDEKIASKRDFELAATEYELAKSTTAAAYQRLANYGFGREQIAQIDATQSTSSLMQILSPFSGTLIDRQAVVGEAVKIGDTIFMIADLSTMWLELSIPEDYINHVSVGDSVEATFETMSEKRIQGEVTWVSTGIDEQTRMLKGRAVVPNPDRTLKHGMFGQADVASKHLVAGLYVPIESLHRLGPERSGYVFTREADDLFEVRRVNTGAKKGKYVEILAGLRPEDQVVTAHSFTVKSEFLKARLGAGCVDD